MNVINVVKGYSRSTTTATEPALPYIHVEA